MRTLNSKKSLIRLRINSQLIKSICVAIILFVATISQAGTLYLADGTNLYEINTATAAKTYVAPGPCDGLALSPNSNIYLYCTQSLEGEGGILFSLFRDGSNPHLVTMINGDADRGLAYNTNDGLLYGTDNQSFGTIDPQTGLFSALTSPSTEPECLAADPNNNLIFGVDGGESLISYDIGTDSWSTVGVTSVNDGGKGGLAFDPITNILYFINRDGELFTIDPTNADTTFIGTVPDVDYFVGLTYVPLLEGDMEPDGDVDGDDLHKFAINFGKTY